jgi:hypothetical protein
MMLRTRSTPLMGNISDGVFAFQICATKNSS